MARIGVHCKSLLECMLLMRIYSNKNYKWENGTIIEYNSRNSRYHFYGNQTAYAFDEDTPNVIYRSSVVRLRQNGVEVLSFDDFYFKTKNGG